MKRRSGPRVTVPCLAFAWGAVVAGCATLPVSNPADPCLGYGQTEAARQTDPQSFDTLPEAVVKVPPVYPNVFRGRGLDRTVIVMALVCVDSTVGDARVEKSTPMLDEASIEAVRQWRFKPGTVNGRPVAVWVSVPVTFHFY